jgi:hypothetical protein
MLLSECSASNVNVFPGARIREVQQQDQLKDEPGVLHKFVVLTNIATFCAPALVVATGGLSIPKMGASGFGYDLARQFGVPISECRPALVPLVLGGEERASLCDLTGVSADVRVSLGKHSFREKLLITHRGLSGPAVLQISSYWNGSEPVLIDWAPEQDILSALRRPGNRRDLTAAKAALREKVPIRLAERLLELAKPTAFTNHALAQLEQRLHAWPFTPVGTEGYGKAEVTAGGVSTLALSAKTMECRQMPGLYFVGEVVDVTGQLGGFNFQWAWASGAAAGRAV